MFGASESTLTVKEQCRQNGGGPYYRLCAGELIGRLETPRNAPQ